MLRYQRGEVRAFEILLARHRRGVFSFIARLVGIDAVAEELLQETFLRVIRGAEGYQKQAKFTTWLYTIARNLCVDQSRRQKHRKAASLDAPASRGEEDGPTLGEQVAGHEPGTDRQAKGKELVGRIEAAMGELPDDQREVFIMREMLEMPFAEIAKVVGAPENTVKSRMRYALERLRGALHELHDGNGPAAVGSTP
jgi:RNA polymerase sigma-70 factor (ECF subfamily)